MARIDRNPPPPPKAANVSASTVSHRATGKSTALPVFTEAQARYVTGTSEAEKAFPVAAGARDTKLSKEQTLAMDVLLRAAGLMFRNFDPNPGDQDPNSGVG